MRDAYCHVLKELREFGLIAASEWPELELLPADFDLVESQEGVLAPRHAIQLIDEERLKRLLADIGVDVALVFTTASTNTDLVKVGLSRSIHRSVCVAEHQSSGRGRRGRKWISPFARCVALSIGYESKKTPLQLQGLSLAVGVAVCEVLQRFGAAACQLKWPNDVLHSGDKLCGILIEHQQHGDMHQYVAGIGVNIALTPDECESVTQRVCSLTDIAGVNIDRTALSADITREVLAAVGLMESSGFGAFSQRYARADWLFGKPIELSMADGSSVVGTGAGVTCDGALLVQTSTGLRHFIGGEVSVRTRPAGG